MEQAPTESLPVSTLLDVISLFKNTDKTALIIPADVNKFEVSYRAFFDQVITLAKQLVASGISSGDAVAMVIPNNYAFLVIFFAVTIIKGIISPLNPAYKLIDFDYYLKDIHAKAIIVPAEMSPDDDALKAAKQLNVPVWTIKEGPTLTLTTQSDLKTEPSDLPEKPQGNDIALLLHTSGTTSLPKGVPLTHLNLVTSITNISNTYELTPTDTTIIVMPLFHVHGLLGATLSTLLTGGTLLIPPRFSATTFWPQVKQYNITWYTAVPTIHQILLLRAQSPEDPAKHIPPSLNSPSQLRFIRSCSSSLAPAIFNSLKEWLQVPVLEAYAMTEASHMMTSNPLPKHGVAKIGSVGLPVVGLTIRHQDEDEDLGIHTTGEICIKGLSVTHGYWNRPEANKSSFTASGWFRTGDSGYKDQEGYVFITGRIKEMINRGGEKISPLELDTVLLSHPKIKDAVAFGAPDEKYGEQVNCAVIGKEGLSLTEKEVVDFIGAKLSAFKVPSKVFICEEFPRTATGKIQRRFVADFFLKGSK